MQFLTSRFGGSIVLIFAFLSFSIHLSFAPPCAGQPPKIQDALAIRPSQKDIQYDTPEVGEIESCRIEKSSEKFKIPGWVLYDGGGRILRQFFDVNQDGSLDQWSYFKDGIEVYRDVDSDYDKQADQFRWLGTAGIRWGKDENKDGQIDTWVMISASEVTEEVFQAIRTADAGRFRRLLLTSNELKALNLGESMTAEVSNRVRQASAKFDSFAKSQDSISDRSVWMHLGSNRPGLVPKGQEGIEADVVILDHASAVVQTGNAFQQISMGTILRVDDNLWRVIELPQIVKDGEIVQNGGVFYPNNALASTNAEIANASDPAAEEMTELFAEFDALEKQIGATRSKSEIAKLEEQRTGLLMKLALASPEIDDKKNWVRQMADMATSAFQSDSFPNAIEVLESKIDELKRARVEDEIPYIRWRIIYAKFHKGHQGDSRQRNEANEKYLKDLEQFTNDFPKSNFAADAMLQLGLTAEAMDRDDPDTAVEWYTKCQTNFPNTIYGKKADGALLRLTGTGKPIRLAGNTISGQTLDIQSSDFRGKVIVVHYWETWCDTCIGDFEELQRLLAKYKEQLVVVGANLDQETQQAKDYLNKNRSINWPQLHSPGGVDKSALAIQLGVATIPMTILIDQRGNLVEGNIAVGDLDREIQRLIRRDGSQADRSGTRR
jgi:thiol-disulfide isomerase/thioredoxin